MLGSKARQLFYCLRRSRSARRYILASLALAIGTEGLQDAVAIGDTREISLHHTHTKEDLTITFKRNGRYDEASLETLNIFLRDWRTDDKTKMDPQLFDVIWEVQREFGSDKTVHIISAYRSPKTNAMLRQRGRGVAKHSQHMQGKAMDFAVPGVPLEDIRNAGLRLQRGGVGFYPTSGSPFVHLDTGSVRHWPRIAPDQLARVMSGASTRTAMLENAPRSEAASRKVGDNDSAGKPKLGFLKKLFGFVDDDHDDVATPTLTAKKDAKQAMIAASVANPSVPMPQARLAGFQVAADASRSVPSDPNSPAAIVKARGLWSVADYAPNEADQGAVSMSASKRALSNSLDVTASAPAEVSVAEDVNGSGGSAAYTLASSYNDVPKTVLVDAVMATTVGPAGRTGRGGVSANDPWLRAVILTPSVQDSLSVAAFGAQDHRALGHLMMKPNAVLVTAFIDADNVGLRCDQFSGSVLAFVPSIDFKVRTADVN